MVFSGLSPDGRLVEMIELTDHPYYVACQFHPELKSRPDNAHPLFVGLVEAALVRSNLTNAEGAATKAPIFSDAKEANQWPTAQLDLSRAVRKILSGNSIFRRELCLFVASPEV